MKKRLLAAVLCIVMLLSCVPSFAFKAQASDIPVIRCNGTAQSSVSFPRNERLTLTAVNGSQFQWQIWVSDDLWVNISGATGDTLDVSYAMIANLCEGDTAYIRVRAMVDGQQVCSDYVAVTAAEAKIEAAEEPATYVVQAAPEAIIYESSAPTQATQAPQADNSAAIAEAQAAVQAAETAVSAAYATWQEKEAAYYAQEAVYTPLAEDAAAKLAAYEAAQAKADAAKQAWLNSGVEVEVTPAETSAEEFDEAGNPVVLVPAQTAVSYNAELEAAYNAAQAEADSALQSYQAAEAARAEAEATLNAIDAEWIAADNALAAAQDALEDACLALDALQGSPGSSNYGLSANSGAATYDLEPTTGNFSVVINYLSESGAVVADPYIASLAAGSNFSATVTFPTVMGYLPYLGENQQNTLELNISAINQDHTFNVVYKPTNVNYTVIHYQQNLNDDKYTEKERETKQGLTNSTVPEVAKKYEGFYALLYEKPAIAADGSTVVEVYYDRYYYLMNFDLDGGYGVEPIYARYGAPVSVGTPKKAGYSFSGWTLDGVSATIPTTMPAEKRTYKAVWTADATAKVTVVFWGENADDKEYSYIKSAEVYVKPGTEFTYSESGTLICVIEEHTHNLNDCYQLTCAQEVHTHSASCYTCGEGSHTHGTTCYAGVGSRSAAGLGAPDNPSNGYVAREAFSWDGKVIYINGTWYKYTGTTGTGSIATPTCGQTEGTHTHTDACLGCNKTAHDHSVENGCYTLTCTKKEHTHSDACHMNGAGLDKNLWTFVRSENVTVAADGSSVVNVYYKRTEKTLTFKYKYSNRNYQTTKTITAKWGADISEQYKEIAKDAGSTFWSARTDGEGPYTNYFGVMPQTSATYYNRGDSGKNGTMTYWGQGFNGEYTVKLFEVTGVGGYSVTDEDRYEFEGFTYHHGTSNGSSCSGAAFYYTRNSYTLTFSDGYNEVKSESVLYQASLDTYSSFIPAVPSAYEPGSVTFGGWYLNPECSGAEYKLDEHTMPADNVLLYAKWVPTTHKVEFYLDANALTEETKLSSHPDIIVPHGSLATPTPADPTNGNYTFVGWFYMENGVEKAFDFANMPVTKDLQVYGKWSSNVLKEYTILYKIQGTDTKIADPTTGSGLAGITKTFDAKGGTDLYANYQEGYFPVTKSHSMTLDIDGTEENGKNIFTFWYVQKDAVPYTVKYLDKETGLPVETEKTVSDNRKAVVTETFVPVSGMMPDAYQKRLVVSVDENGNPDTEHNVIIFYYTKDTTHAYYKITHYTENLAKDAQDNTTWTEYASSQAVGDIGTTYTADPMTIPGYTYDSSVPGTVASGKLTADGLELKLYYTRNSYPYQVRYLEQGSGKELADPKNGTGKYGEVISESAIEIANYTAVDPTSQTLNIKIETQNDQGQIAAALNVITFYYTENEATIHYEVVGPTGCGTVSPTSETLKVLSGTAQGSNATVSSNAYKFVGWYKDATCTQAVDTSWVDANNKLAPTKAAGDAWVNGTTYYAKFEYDLTTLTITKSGNVGAKDGFIFDVKVKGEDTILFTVSVQGNGSVTIEGLKVGTTYTVTERRDWAWRYSVPNAQEITLVANGNTATFENGEGKPYLLDGSDYARNNSALYSASGEN